MGTQVQHEPPNPEIVPPVLPLEDGSSQTIQPIVPPAPLPTDDSSRYLTLMESTIREQNRQIQDLNNRLTAAPVVPAAPPKSADELRAEFYNDPTTHTRSIIREELRETVAPLLEFVTSMKQTSKVDQLINQFKVDARFVGQWDAAIESIVRENAGGMPPAQLTEQVFGMMVLSAIGMKHAGMLRPANGAPPAPAPTPTPTPAPTPVPRTDPPHMRPSPPSGPTNNTQRPARRALSEEELRIARENHMTADQYLDWQEAPSAEVAHSKIGVPVPPARS